MPDSSFISIDWGASNFRLRLVEKSSLTIIEEIADSTGVMTLYLQWQQRGGDRETILLDFLKQQIGRLQTIINKDIEIVISGMASSGIGIRELPYAALPFRMDGTGLHVAQMEHSLFPYGFKLISGVQAGSDVIRGEEVQIIGLAEDEDFYGTVIFVLPGTHSKHIFCKNGSITHFDTFMTGELFQAIRTHTILENSVEASAPDTDNFKAFEEGVLRSGTGSSILNSIFKVRAWDLLGKLSPKENYYYLSGVLIGEEIASLHSLPVDNIRLCAGRGLHEFYARAIGVLGLSGKTDIVPEEKVEMAVIKGQAIVLKQPALCK